HSRKGRLDFVPLHCGGKRGFALKNGPLRQIAIGLGGRGRGVPRETGFDITAASEVMAILCLAQSRADLKERLGNIFIGFSRAKKPVYARELKVHGAMCALL